MRMRSVAFLSSGRDVAPGRLQEALMDLSHYRSIFRKCQPVADSARVDLSYPTLGITDDSQGFEDVLHGSRTRKSYKQTSWDRRSFPLFSEPGHQSPQCFAR